MFKTRSFPLSYKKQNLFNLKNAKQIRFVASKESYGRINIH